MLEATVLMVNKILIKWTLLLLTLFYLDFDQATQRMCVQRGPDDNENRCAYTIYNYKQVYICFCQGDLCNSSHKTFSQKNQNLLLLTIVFGVLFSCLKIVNCW